MRGTENEGGEKGIVNRSSVCSVYAVQGTENTYMFVCNHEVYELKLDNMEYLTKHVAKLESRILNLIFRFHKFRTFFNDKRHKTFMSATKSEIEQKINAPNSLIIRPITTERKQSNSKHHTSTRS